MAASLQSSAQSVRRHRGAVGLLLQSGMSLRCEWQIVSSIVSDADEQKPDAELIALFQRQDGMRTEVVLGDGRRLSVWNIAWGYDMGDEYAHITTNCSPPVGHEPVDFFLHGRDHRDSRHGHRRPPSSSGLDLRSCPRMR